MTLHTQWAIRLATRGPTSSMPAFAKLKAEGHDVYQLTGGSLRVEKAAEPVTAAWAEGVKKGGAIRTPS